MKVLIYEPFILWNYHFGTTLEIANNHLIDNHEVHFLFCDSSMKYCQVNNGKENYCVHCIGSADTGLKLLDNDKFTVHYLNIDKFFPNIKFPYFENYEQLKSYKLYGIKFGLSVLSSLITLTREPKLNLNKIQKYIHTFLKNSVSIYFQSIELLKEYKFDKVYIFNGRFFSQLPLVEACKKMRIDFYCHERAGVLNRYALTKNLYIHNIDFIINSIEEEWNKEKDFSKKFKIANQFYFNRRFRKTDYSFTDKQIKNKLPDNFDKNKYNIVIYDSSIDEYEAIEDFENNHFKDIYKIIRYILENTQDENIHFYLRNHPNLKGINNSQTQEIKKLEYLNLTVIEPDSNIDTYTLMETCDKVITFGSTTEVEANFLEKTVISIGISSYDRLNISYKPRNYEEIINLVKDQNLLPKSIEGSIKFGYWVQNYGHEFKFYKPLSENEGLFKNKIIEFDYKDINIFSKTVKKVINNFEGNIFNLKVEEPILIIFIIDNKNFEKVNSSINSILKQTYISNINLIILDLTSKNINLNIKNMKYKYLSSNDDRIIKELVDNSTENYYLIMNSDTLLLEFTIEFLIKKIKKENFDLLTSYIYDYKENEILSYDNLLNTLIKKNFNKDIKVNCLNYPLMMIL